MGKVVNRTFEYIEDIVKGSNFSIKLKNNLKCSKITAGGPINNPFFRFFFISLFIAPLKFFQKKDPPKKR